MECVKILEYLYLFFDGFYMSEIVFNTILTNSGTLFCPKEYLFNDAQYKVIVSLPEIIDDFSDDENASLLDNSTEYLSKNEINYYLK